MAIADFKYPIQDPEAQARGVANLKTQFAERVRTHGLESARKQLAIVGLEPSFDDVREAERTATKTAYDATRAGNPWAAARIGSVAPEVYAPGPAPAAPTAADSFAASRARVASASPAQSAAAAAWIDATKAMTQTAGGRK